MRCEHVEDTPNAGPTRCKRQAVGRNRNDNGALERQCPDHSTHPLACAQRANGRIARAIEEFRMFGEDGPPAGHRHSRPRGR